MKAIKVIFYLMILLMIGSCKPFKRNLPIGAWQLVYAKHMAADSVITEFPGNIQGAQIKIWSEKNFFFAGSRKVLPDTVTEILMEEVLIN